MPPKNNKAHDCALCNHLQAQNVFPESGLSWNKRVSGYPIRKGGKLLCFYFLVHLLTSMWRWIIIVAAYKMNKLFTILTRQLLSLLKANSLRKVFKNSFTIARFPSKNLRDTDISTGCLYMRSWAHAETNFMVQSMLVLIVVLWLVVLNSSLFFSFCPNIFSLTHATFLLSCTLRADTSIFD